MSSNKNNQKIDRYAEMMNICVNYSFKQTSRIITQFYDNMFKEVGIRSTQFSLLTSVKICKDCTFDQLAASINMDSTTLTRNLQALEKRGFIEIVTGKDKRTKMAYLTPEGEEVLKKAFPIWKKAQRHFVQGLGAENWNSIKQSLETILKLGKNNIE